ncbi:MAG: hypothetical protein EXS08_03595 [Planctomycetes bacterium]|nr:hypothetical protein [Planctomycetota bacterium]
MSRFQRFLASFVGALLVACASTGAGRGAQDDAPGEYLVTLRNFKTGERFELASESHTDRVSYYSETRADATRKVQADEVMEAFVEELGDQGFDSKAQVGKAPGVASGDVIRWGLEIAHGETRRHWLVGTGSQAADWQTFQKCRDTFLQLYNITVSYQTVQNQSGRQFFQDQPQGAGAPQKP